MDEVRSVTDRQCPIHVFDHALPASAHADDRLLRHIFINLLTNAVKYSAPGTPVEFQIAAQAADAVCVIRDRGIGIPESDREWLFEAFHRGRNVGERFCEAPDGRMRINVPHRYRGQVPSLSHPRAEMGHNQ